MAKGNDLKALEQKLVDAENELESIINKQTKLQKERSLVENKRDTIKRQISALTKNFTVSEHALLRYIQRLYGANLDAIEKSLLDSKSLQKYSILGDGEYPTDDGLKMIIKNKIVVTVRS